MWVKVCGITREQDARLAAELGATAIGFVFWPGSRRFVEPEEARRIASRMPAGLLRVGVFVNQSVAEVARVASEVGLGAVQLHGDESPADFAGIGATLIKAVPLGAGAPDVPLADLPAEVLVLVEGAGPAVRGGAGSVADWSRAADLAVRRRTILAGGLTPENVASAIAAVRPFGVDVSSGVEARPGIKDPDLLRRFIDAASSDVIGGVRS